MSRVQMSDAVTVASSPQPATPEPRHNLRSRLLRQIKRQLVRLGGNAVVTSRVTCTGSAPAPAALVLPIAQDGEDSVNLIEITPWTPVKIFEPKDYDHVWCLVVDETRFSLQDATGWIIATREANVRNLGQDLPTVALILKMDEVSAAELAVASSQLSSAGVLFTRWPHHAVTVVQALLMIREQLQENYGEPNFDRQVRWGHAITRNENPKIVPAV